MDIVRDDDDRQRFMRSLFYLNDVYSDPYWHQATAGLPAFVRPPEWPERVPLVRILAWTLLGNHFHLLVQEISDGGTAKFMQRLGGSMSMCFNLKHKGRGSIFQGAYHGRVVERPEHLNYLAFYILVKNVLEMYPGGLNAALARFDEAWEWATSYPFSSLAGLVKDSPTPIVSDEDYLLSEVIGKGNAFKSEAKELLIEHVQSHGGDFKSLMLEPW